MHPVLFPGTLILSAIRHHQDALTIALAVLMLTHIFHIVLVHTNPYAIHFVLFEHAMVSEGVEEERTYAVLLHILVDLSIVNVILFANTNKVLLAIETVKLGVVLGDKARGILLLAELEFHLFDGISHAREQLVLFEQESLLIQEFLEGRH